MAMTELPEEMISIATVRRGGLPVFDRCDPARSAIMVIDMQNAWLDPAAAFHTPPALDIVPAVNRVVGELRRRGGRVIWIQSVCGPYESEDYWAMYFDNFVGPAARKMAADALTPGGPLFDIHDSLDVQDSDLRWRKYRFGVFTRNKIDVEAELRALGVDNLIVTGISTNGCCDTTAREAMMRDFRTFMPHDAVATQTVQGHLAGLFSAMQSFADVRPTDELIDLLGQRAAPSAA